MVSLLMESVVVSFALGGVVGAVIAIHLLLRKKVAPVFSQEREDGLEGRVLLQRKIDSKFIIPPRR